MMNVDNYYINIIFRLVKQLIMINKKDGLESQFIFFSSGNSLTQTTISHIVQD